MNDPRNWLERLGDKIPGYQGYAARERRRDLDRLQREHLADRLRAIKTPLTEVIREMTATGRLMETGPVDRVIKKLDQIENRLRFASYGYSGFFDVVQIEEPQLDAIHQFDLTLVDKVEALETRARTLVATVSRGNLQRSVTEIERAVDELNQTFDQRHQAIEGFGRGEDVSPGQPMFGVE